MTHQSKQSANEPLPSSEGASIARRHYNKPSLVVRERLSRIAADSKVSGLSTDSDPI